MRLPKVIFVGYEVNNFKFGEKLIVSSYSVLRGRTNPKLELDKIDFFFSYCSLSDRIFWDTF